MPGRVKIGSRSDLPPGAGKVSVACGRALALFNVAGEIHALDNACPHRGGPLGEGHLEGTRVTCPWHGWQFDVRTGSSPLKPEVSVRSVRIETEGDDLIACLD
jgi:nitrite reductase (NADH) small subunit